MSSGADGLTIEQAVDLIGSNSGVSLVALLEHEVAGVALGTVNSGLGWINEITVGPGENPDQELVHELIEQLETRLAERGAHKAAAVVREDQAIRSQLEDHGYRACRDMVYLDRHLASVVAPSAVSEAGGVMLTPHLWKQLEGMDQAKEIIERRVILPLAEPDLASRHSVSPPKAIVLFGPPGTGKTTFAKGIASRLGWPFVEIRPSELGGGAAEGQAKLLGEAFDRVLRLPSAIVFVDEVEELASRRHDARRVIPSVTNEFLKQIPRLREAPRHLLVCATNAVGSLDPAFLRPGRFDYVLPVGLPDVEARAAIWRRYIREITDENVDIEDLVKASDLFTPADIEFAAAKAAQRAFEREHFQGVCQRAETTDFLAAIRDTRPSLSVEMVQTFAEEMERFSRD
ncbi:MAG: AAA family ATPase [Candidatus Dormibacteraceae bacterium]